MHFFNYIAFNDTIKQCITNANSYLELTTVASNLVKFCTKGETILPNAIVGNLSLSLPEPPTTPVVPEELGGSSVSFYSYVTNNDILNISTNSSDPTSSLTFDIPEDLAIGIDEKDEYVSVLPTIIFTANDNNGNKMENLGIAQNPWKLQAKLIVVEKANSTTDAELCGNTLVPFINGDATFYDLTITQYGGKYQLEFVVVVSEVELSKFSFITKTFLYTDKPTTTNSTSSKSTIYAVSGAAAGALVIAIIAGVVHVRKTNKRKRMAVSPDGTTKDYSIRFIKFLYIANVPKNPPIIHQRRL